MLLLVFLLAVGLLWVLLITVAAHPAVGRLNPMSLPLFCALVGVGLLRFWLLDLHEARFQAVLLLIPAGIGVGHFIEPGTLARFLGGLAALWLVAFAMLQRAMGVCCGGPSGVYVETLLGLLAMLTFAAPLAIGHTLRRPLPVDADDLAEVFT